MASVSEKVQQGMADSSWIRRMFDEGTVLKKQYGADNVFDLSLGNPIVEPPLEFHRELKKLADEPLPGMHRYMENAGYAETRTAVAEYLSQETGINFAHDDIVMTCGAAGAANIVLKTVLNPGDEAVIFAPYFAEYIHYVGNHSGVVKIVPADKQFNPRLDILEDTISDRTRAVIVNSPNNPSGVVYDKDILNNLGNVIRKKEAQYGTLILLASDEAYRKIIYDGLEFPQVLQHHHQSVILGSHSKDLALPGERIGYVAVNPECEQREDLIAGLIFCNRVLGFVNAPALMQRVVSHLQQVTVSVADYQRKRDFLCDRLTDMGYSLIKPQGAFYLFPESPLEDDVAFVRELQQWQVLTVPGSGFGSPGYFRISYCVDDRTLEGSLDGFRKAAQQLKLG